MGVPNASPSILRAAMVLAEQHVGLLLSNETINLRLTYRESGWEVQGGAGYLAPEIVPDATEAQGDVVEAHPHGGHSIRFLKYLREQPDASEYFDPVNVVFYGSGLSGNVFQVMASEGWGTVRGEGVCANDLYQFVWDAMHTMTDDWHKTLLHFTIQDSCVHERYHMRLFALAEGAWYDTHTPGFDYYSLGSVHYEWGFCCPVHPEVSPDIGQSHLFWQLWDHPEIHQVWIVNVPVGDCTVCDRWNGDVYFYYTSLAPDPQDPCGVHPTIYHEPVGVWWECTGGGPGGTASPLEGLCWMAPTHPLRCELFP